MEIFEVSPAPDENDPFQTSVKVSFIERSDLLHCPFCGHEAQVAHLLDSEPAQGDCPDTYEISCTNCPIEISSSSMDYAMELWNKREGGTPAPVILCTQCNSHRTEKIGVGLDGYNSRYCWECHAEFSEGGAK